MFLFFFTTILVYFKLYIDYFKNTTILVLILQKAYNVVEVIPMIRNNLSILMSERNIKNNVLSLKTGISKNTISSITNNDVKMIQLDTINKLCQALNVSPGALFTYVPYDCLIELLPDDICPHVLLNESFDLLEFSFKELSFDLFIKISSVENSDIVFHFESSTSGLNSNLTLGDTRLSVYFNLKDDPNLFKHYINDLPISFKIDIYDQITNAFYKELAEQTESYLDGIPNLNFDKSLILNRLPNMVDLEFIDGSLLPF
ncbi:DNA-binding helix-turn-helix protein [Enterococcus faecalis LA3B-2]|nr:DNA-binding helix-turn-helix protein [Enterococcus faecalis LA3B-2]